MLDVEPPSCSAHPESSGRGTPRVLTRVGSAAAVVRDTPSPPQALPAASEAEKRSDGRRRAGSCLGVATLLRQGPSLLVGSRSQHKGGGFSQPGRVPLQSNGKRGNIRDETLVLPRLHGRTLGTAPGLGGRELAQTSGFRRAGKLRFLGAALSRFPHGKRSWDPPAATAPPRPPPRGTTEPQAVAPEQATASGHFAPLGASPWCCRARRGRARLGADPCARSGGTCWRSEGEERVSPMASASQYLWSVPFHGLRDFELPPVGKENAVRMSPCDTDGSRA